MPQSRQLAAIMFTDIVGYTALMQQNEVEAVAVIKHYNLVLEKNVALHHGSILNNYGDGSLCSFSNTSEAVHCALNMQKDLQADPVVPLRIGLHVGEIFFEDGKVLGDGVNVASRIQSLGSANTILFSNEIQDKIKNNPEFKQVSLGLFEFKNVDTPVEVFALTNEGLIVPKKEQMEGKLKTSGRKNILQKPWAIAAIILLLAAGFFLYKTFFASSKFTGDEKSIAVLPFNNLSGDKENEYFSDGMTDEITTQISKIKALKVIGRTSAMQFKGTKKSLRQIGEELGVAALLEGSVLRVGNKVRINAQLIDTKTEANIWANSFDGDINNLFSFHSEVAQQIAIQLNAEFTADEKKKIEKKATQNIAAYDDYLKGKQLMYSWATPGYIDRLEQAEKYFLNALEKDSSFALAWSGLSFTYRQMAAFKPRTFTNHFLNKSLVAGTNGIIYGPELSESYMLFGEILKTITLNPMQALELSRKAVRLNPNNAEAHSHLGFCLSESGLFTEAEIHLKKAKELDPLSGIMKAAWFQFYQNSRNSDGFKKFPFTFNEPENSERTIGSKIWVHFLNDQDDSLLVYSKKKIWHNWMGIAYAKLGQAKNAQIMIDTLKARSETNNALFIGIIYAWMNEKEKALDWLEKAYSLHSGFLLRIKVDKEYDPLRNEPRFKELLRKMGVEE